MTAKLIKHYEPLSVHRIQDYTFKEKLVEDNGDTVRYLPAYRDADGNPTAALVTFYRPAVNILNAKDAKGNYVVNRAVAGSVTLAPLTAIIGKDAVAEFKLAVGQSVEISFQRSVHAFQHQKHQRVKSAEDSGKSARSPSSKKHQTQSGKSQQTFQRVQSSKKTR